MISTRTLNKWRKDALETTKFFSRSDGMTTSELSYLKFTTRILVMTQELLDQNLLEKK